MFRSLWRSLKANLLELSVLAGSLVIPDWILATATAALGRDDIHQAYVLRIKAASTGGKPASAAAKCSTCYDELRNIVDNEREDLTSRARFELSTQAVTVPGFAESELRIFLRA